jgi:hypothetical protein
MSNDIWSQQNKNYLVTEPLVIQNFSYYFLLLDISHIRDGDDEYA